MALISTNKGTFPDYVVRNRLKEENGDFSHFTSMDWKSYDRDVSYSRKAPPSFDQAQNAEELFAAVDWEIHMERMREERGIWDDKENTD